jgi:hypothetical protein
LLIGYCIAPQRSVLLCVDHVTTDTSFGGQKIANEIVYLVCGVLLSDDRVVDLTADRNVQMTTLEGFASGKEVISEKAISSPSEIHKTVYRLRKAYRRQAPYNLIFNNCESFARGAVGEPEVSWQIVALCVVAGVIVLSQARV